MLRAVDVSSCFSSNGGLLLVVHDSRLAFSFFLPKQVATAFSCFFPPGFLKLNFWASGAADGAAAGLFEGSHDDPSVERAPQRKNRLPRDRARGEG